MNERAFWVLKIEVTENGMWDEVREILNEIADDLPDCPTSGKLWDRHGRLLCVSTVEVEDEELVSA